MEVQRVSEVLNASPPLPSLLGEEAACPVCPPQWRNAANPPSPRPCASRASI